MRRRAALALLLALWSLPWTFGGLALAQKSTRVKNQRTVYCGTTSTEVFVATAGRVGYLVIVGTGNVWLRFGPSTALHSETNSFQATTGSILTDSLPGLSVQPLRCQAVSTGTAPIQTAEFLQ